ncbi:MAG: KilA-N domain-containing protein [Desulfobacterales bacterium]
MGKSRKVNVLDKDIMFYSLNSENYISITDIAKYKNPDAPADIVKNWLRSKNTIELLGLWERIHNPDFKLVEFDQFKHEAGYNHFVLSPKKWIESTNAIGMLSKSGRNGGTFAHADIALEFASWVSVEFKFYLLKEFQRLKEAETKELDWSVKRNLTKINYRIHTDAIKAHLIPAELTRDQINLVYASEADVLNMALFGKTAKQWRDENPSEKGNIRDFANVSQLVCLANLENLNAHFIQEGLTQAERLERLNQIAIQQMRLLVDDRAVKQLGEDEE